MSVIEGTQRLKEATGAYDFAVDGGAVSTITLRGVGINGGEIPNGSVITGGYIDVATQPTSGGLATIAVNSQAAADLKAATAVTALTVGRHDVIPDATGDTSVKTTARRNLAIAIATAALTAGKFTVTVFYR